MCTATTVLIAGASLEESISVPCRVIADPSDVTFEWTFSSSGERFEVPHGHYTTIQQQQHHQLDFPGLDGQSSIIETNEQHVESDGNISINSFTASLDINLVLISGKYVVETVSELIYTPKNERDYGTLACWGKNSIGKQSEPCLYQVVPAGEYFNHIQYFD